MSSLNLYLAICKDFNQGGPRHWIIVLAEDNATHGVWYHSTGGPILTQPYRVEITPKPFNSFGVERHEFISKISENDRTKVTAAARKHPAVFCQRWVVNVLYDLEKQNLVPEGTWEKWTAAMEVDPYSDDGAPSAESKKSSSDENAAN